MKRFLALLLTLVMLVSVCGLQAFAADGDTSADTGDELVVYTRSGATRTFHVGDTFSYTYWFRLTSGSVNKITGHVLYDSQCLSVNADGCKFPNMTSPSTKNNAGDFEFHEMHYYIFKFKAGLLSPWLLGVSGGYEGDNLTPCGHTFSDMKKYQAAAAQKDCMETIERIRAYWMEQAKNFTQQ